VTRMEDDVEPVLAAYMDAYGVKNPPSR